MQMLFSEKRNRPNRSSILHFNDCFLENRVLNAIFTFDAISGVLSVETDQDNEIFSIAATSAFGNYTIDSTFNFTGTDSAGNVTGAGGNTLSILGNSSLTSIFINGNPANSGSSLNFANSAGNNFINNVSVNFSNASSGTINIANTTVFANDSSLSLTTTGNTISVLSNLSVSGSGTFQLSAESVNITAIASSQSSISIMANSLELTGNLSNPTGSIDIIANCDVNLGTKAAGNLSLTNTEMQSISATSLTILSLTGSVTISNSISYPGYITLFADQDITETAIGRLALPGNASITSAQGLVNLNNATNDFTSLNITANSSITARDSNDISIAGMSAANATIIVNGSISQSSVVSVTDNANFVAGGSINFSDPVNDFKTITANGTNITIADGSADGLILGIVTASNLTVTTSAGNITQTSPVSVPSGTSNFSSIGFITLDDANNDFGTIVANAADISIRDQNAITLGLITAANLTVNATSINQSDSANVTVAANFISLSAITLNQANNTIGDLKSNGFLVISNGNYTSLTATGGNATISGGNITAATATSVGLKLMGGSINSLQIDGGTSNLSSGTVSGNVTLKSGNLISTINLSSLTVNSTTTANITGGVVQAVTSCGTLNLSSGSIGNLSSSGTAILTGGNVTGSTDVIAGNLSSSITFGNLTISGGTANLTAGSAATTHLQSGNLVTRANLGALTVDGGMANLISGNISGLTQGSGGEVWISANITGNASLQGGNTTLFAPGQIIGTTDISILGNFVSNGTLGNLTVTNSRSANLIGGSATNIFNNGGVITVNASVSGLNDVNDGTTTLHSSGNVIGLTTVKSTTQTATFISTGNISALTVGANGTACLSGGVLSGALNIDSNGTLNLSGNTIVNNATTISGGNVNFAGSSIINGPVLLNSGSLIMSSRIAANLTIQNGSANVLTTGNVSGETVMNNGSLYSNGVFANLVLNNGTLYTSSNGTRAALLQFNNNVTWNATGSSLSDFSKITVAGPVTISPNAILTLVSPANLTYGQGVTLIDQSSNTPINQSTGFSGMAQGVPFANNNNTIFLNYNGSSGNYTNASSGNDLNVQLTAGKIMVLTPNLTASAGQLFTSNLIIRVVTDFISQVGIPNVNVMISLPTDVINCNIASGRFDNANYSSRSVILTSDSNGNISVPIYANDNPGPFQANITNLYNPAEYNYPYMGVIGVAVQQQSINRSYIRYMDVVLSDANLTTLNYSTTNFLANFTLTRVKSASFSGGANLTDTTNYLANGPFVPSIYTTPVGYKIDFGMNGLGNQTSTAVYDGVYQLANKASATAVPANAPYAFHRLLGDANGDGVVDALDTNLIRTVLVSSPWRYQNASNLTYVNNNMSVTSVNPVAAYNWVGDLNGDGKINALDLNIVTFQKGRQVNYSRKVI